MVFNAGIVLGTLFFSGLWFTVKKAITSKIPAIWFFSSFTLRVCLVMIGYYYIAPGGWLPLIVCTFGFIVARVVVTHITKSIDKNQAKREVYNEA
jgi:F1F0 ATPase subunit 2